MNQKTAKKLRKIAKQSNANYERLKTGYAGFNKHERAVAKLAMMVHEDNKRDGYPIFSTLSEVYKTGEGFANAIYFACSKFSKKTENAKDRRGMPFIHNFIMASDSPSSFQKNLADAKSLFSVYLKENSDLYYDPSNFDGTNPLPGYKVVNEDNQQQDTGVDRTSRDQDQQGWTVWVL